VSDLKLLKLSSGEVVIGEVTYEDLTYSYVVQTPLVINQVNVKGGEATTAHPYLPGTDAESISISSQFVMSVVEANEFYHRFYGTSVFRFIVNKEVQRMTLHGIESMDRHTKIMLDLKRGELSKKYGMVDEEGVALDFERIIH